jgi:hypothetical protein
MCLLLFCELACPNGRDKRHRKSSPSHVSPSSGTGRSILTIDCTVLSHCQSLAVFFFGQPARYDTTRRQVIDRGPAWTCSTKGALIIIVGFWNLGSFWNQEIWGVDTKWRRRPPPPREAPPEHPVTQIQHTHTHTHTHSLCCHHRRSRRAEMAAGNSFLHLQMLCRYYSVRTVNIISSSLNIIIN